MPVIKNALLRYRIIDRCIRNKYKSFPNKEDLRQECELELYGSSHGEHISDSTIEKDLFAMRMDSDAPIKYCKRNRGYFYEDPNFSLDDIPLNEEDVEAIRFAAQTLFQFKNVDVFKQFGFAIDKILDRVNISQNMEDEAIGKYVQFETVDKVGGAELLNGVLKCIKEKLKIKFDYQSFTSKKAKARLVHPYLLKEYRNRWYLLGFSEEKQDIITYGLDRMTNFEGTEDYFLMDENFNADNFFKHAIGITADHRPPEKIRFKVSSLLGKYLTTQPLHHSQSIQEQKDGESIVELTILVTQELKMQLLSYGETAKVLEPQHLLEYIQNQTKRTFEQY